MSPTIMIILYMIGRQMDRYVDRQIDRQVDRQIYIWIDRLIKSNSMSPTI